ncbi:MAG: hypothetical protein U0359_29040 [Byssovorax sp.]
MAKPRRARYGAPIVITIAAVATSGCGSTPEYPPNPPPPEPIHRNPPAQEIPTAPPTATFATPPPTAKPTAQIAGNDLPPPTGHGRVETNPDGSCTEYPDLSGFTCPPGMTCNPPPPRKVRCPTK